MRPPVTRVRETGRVRPAACATYRLCHVRPVPRCHLLPVRPAVTAPDPNMTGRAVADRGMVDRVMTAPAHDRPDR